jgi:hypothetical protein
MFYLIHGHSIGRHVIIQRNEFHIDRRPGPKFPVGHSRGGSVQRRPVTVLVVRVTLENKVYRKAQARGFDSPSVRSINLEIVGGIFLMTPCLGFIETPLF